LCLVERRVSFQDPHWTTRRTRMRGALREYSLTWGVLREYSLTHPGVCLVPGPALDDHPTPAHAQPAAAPAPGAASATAPSQAAAEVARPTEARIAPVAAEVASARSGTDEASAGGSDAAAPRSAPLASALPFCCNVQRVATACIMRAGCLQCVATSCEVAHSTEFWNSTARRASSATLPSPSVGLPGKNLRPVGKTSSRDGAAWASFGARRMRLGLTQLNGPTGRG
jgi:hypothetical protein